MRFAWVHLGKRLLTASTLWVAVVVPAQGTADTKAISSVNDGSVTIDASRLTSITTIDSAWRFASDDNPHYADPGFDDSKWPLIPPGEDRLLATFQAPNVQGGRDWARLHIHVLNESAPLAITISSVRLQMPYAVFANGIKIGETKGLGTQTFYMSRDFGMTLPKTANVVLAINVVLPSPTLLHYFPLEEIKIGQAAELNAILDLERYRKFENSGLVDVCTSLLCFVGAVLSLILLMGQRNHTEYLWLAVYFFFAATSSIWHNARSAGMIPPLEITRFVGFFFDSLEAVAFVEFVVVLSAVRSKKLVRLLQVLCLSFSLTATFSSEGGYLNGLAIYVLEFIAVLFMLLPAYRSGETECGLLIVPALLYDLSISIANAKAEFPKWLGDSWQGHVRGVGFTLYDLSYLQFGAGILAVVLYRFIRVSKDEEIAAAELDAAKTVQRLLIPATQAATPGFAVESAYLPARQVGGDFFLVLPDAEVSGNGSLLAVMGDVSGKGLQAAMVVSTIMGGLRMGLVREPAAVLKYLNRMLVGHISGFATCVAVLIQPDGQMTIANAGNPAPYAGGHEVPTLPGLPLGMIADLEYQETAYRLDAGSRMTFVSDGVIEATSATSKELFGFDRTQAMSPEPASVIAEAACTFGAGAPQADDITVLTICVTGS